MNLLGIEELSEYIKLSKSTIYKRTALRSIPFIKTGKNLLFRKEAIDLWLEGCHQPTAEEINKQTVEKLKTEKYAEKK
jgi:excisionase family DNA binding protein